jgi:hypothetical protein
MGYGLLSLAQERWKPMGFREQAGQATAQKSEEH